jgi:hypothetical protein
VSETRGVDFGDNAAAQTLIDAMPEELRARFVALEGRIIPRDPELPRGAFLVLKHYDRHPLRQAIYIRTIAFHLLAISSNLWGKWHAPVAEQREVPLHPAIVALFGLRIATHRNANHPGVLANGDDLTQFASHEDTSFLCSVAQSISPTDL